MMGADHAFYYERARVLLPFRSVVRASSAYSQALAEFETTLKKEPNRLGATLAAEAAAEKSGDSAKARQYWRASIPVLL